MTLTCPVCKKKFHKGKTNEFGRQSRHLWKHHPEYMRRKIKSGQRKAKKKIRPLDREFMAIDDMLLAEAFGQKQYAQPYDATHEQLGGLILQALIPIVTNAIVQSMKKRSGKK